MCLENESLRKDLEKDAEEATQLAVLSQPLPSAPFRGMTSERHPQPSERDLICRLIQQIGYTMNNKLQVYWNHPPPFMTHVIHVCSPVPSMPVMFFCRQWRAMTKADWNWPIAQYNTWPMYRLPLTEIPPIDTNNTVINEFWIHFGESNVRQAVTKPQ